MTRRETTTRQAKMPAAARAGKQHAEPPGPGWRAVMLRVAGAGLLIAAGAIHLDLYLTGYRTIPTIGWLFLLQVIAAFGLGLAVLATGGRSRRRPAGGRGGSRLRAGYPRRLPAVGLDRAVRVQRGPHHRRPRRRRDRGGRVRGPGRARACSCPGGRRGQGPGRRRGSDPVQIPRPDPPGSRPGGSNDRGGAGGCGAGAARSRSSRGQSSRASRREHGREPEDHDDRRDDGTDQRPGLHRSTGSPRTPRATSKCYGSCAAYWPPVTGTAAASPGLPGRIGTITRTGGARQLTYNGHPLYTYIGDSAPGQAKGNNLNLNGGLWHEVRVSR